MFLREYQNAILESRTRTTSPQIIIQLNYISAQQLLRLSSTTVLQDKHIIWPLYSQLMENKCNLELRLETLKDIDESIDHLTKIMIESAKQGALLQTSNIANSM